jgi:hypothetical protein
MSVQQPKAISLVLADKVIFEHGTQKPYLLGIFTGLAVEAFPTVPQRFDIFAALTDGLGDVTITLSVVHLDADQEVYSQTMTVGFGDPLQIVNVRFRIRQLVFDTPGSYLFALAVGTEDGDEEIAARRIRVYEADLGES